MAALRTSPISAAPSPGASRACSTARSFLSAQSTLMAPNYSFTNWGGVTRHMHNHLLAIQQAHRACRLSLAVLIALAGALVLSALSLRAAPSVTTYYVDPAGNNAN